MLGVLAKMRGLCSLHPQSSPCWSGQAKAQELWCACRLLQPVHQSQLLPQPPRLGLSLLFLPPSALIMVHVRLSALPLPLLFWGKIITLNMPFAGLALLLSEESLGIFLLVAQVSGNLSAPREDEHGCPANDYKCHS